MTSLYLPLRWRAPSEPPPLEYALACPRCGHVTITYGEAQRQLALFAPGSAFACPKCDGPAEIVS